MTVSISSAPGLVEGRPGQKPRRWGSFYVAEHKVRGMRSYAQTVIVTTFGNPLLYLFGLGVGLAHLINAPVNGATYLQFVAPALLASAAVTVSANEFSYPVIAGFKWNAIFYGMNAAPISPTQIVNGFVLGVLVHMVPTVGVYYLFMLLFGAVASALGVLSILTALLTGLSVGLIIMASMARVEDDRGQPALFQRFGVMPMFLFSGTFFPLSHLPIYLQWIGWISPLWHGTQLGRDLSYGMSEPAWLVVAHVVYLVAIGILGWYLTVRTFTRRLNK
ncbi:MAG TPA: ABC transporter permease [Galbitalea sp.]|nr:ABC transporter permease [Galbitalea sp.]